MQCSPVSGTAWWEYCACMCLRLSYHLTLKIGRHYLALGIWRLLFLFLADCHMNLKWRLIQYFHSHRIGSRCPQVPCGTHLFPWQNTSGGAPLHVPLDLNNLPSLNSLDSLLYIGVLCLCLSKHVFNRFHHSNCNTMEPPKWTDRLQ